MKNQIVLLLLVYLIINVASDDLPLIHFYGEIKQEQIIGNPGERLILTPLIEQRQIQEAQAAAEVDQSVFLGVKSYAGYFTVNKTYNSNLFFWFFPSETDYENDPVVLWLQGGPGTTSLFGLFNENGPFSVKNDLKLTPRVYSWTQSHSVIYIDNPVGTGYSFTDGGYAGNEMDVGEDLYNALIQFFTMFPELQLNDFYITGESYAGKYVPAIGHTIHKKNPQASLKINMQGLAIGNGFTDPEHQLNYSDYLFQLGLIDSSVKKKFKEKEQQALKLIQNGNFLEAFRTQLYYFKTTPETIGCNNLYNYLYPKYDINVAGVGKFVQLSNIRSAIHVGDTPFTWQSFIVYKNLAYDFMQSVSPWVSELLNNYRVMIYTGQLDIIVAYPLTVNYLENLEKNYISAPRHIWNVDDEIAGYVKQTGNLTDVLVRRAGHMVPTDQPKWAADLIYRFTRRLSFY